MKRILILGALESEITYYLKQECFHDAEKTVRNGFTFYVKPPDDTNPLVWGSSLA